MKNATRDSSRNAAKPDDRKTREDKPPAHSGPKPGPEGRDHLRKRAEWFQHRTSKAPKD